MGWAGQCLGLHASQKSRESQLPGSLSLDHFFHSVDCEAAGILGSTPPKHQELNLCQAMPRRSQAIWTQDLFSLEARARNTSREFMAISTR
ncbi:hypothetical protein AV530_018818 [Patagioenas fasciata monilis]|uniref:Uncharacterized protein n=1 Tax=Patagioenas fasciata monilis TaxID=372326 RepID=A0A1V4JK11_PATFA|nr:hypothetical protein AV530_018818 [Patagioenas fasciata monilis]